MDYGFKRDREPWEASDGAVYLLAGIAEVAPAEVPPLLPQLAELALLDHFPQARSLQTTIWHQLPAILKSLGKKVTGNALTLYITDQHLLQLLLLWELSTTAVELSTKEETII